MMITITSNCASLGPHNDVPFIKVNGEIEPLKKFSNLFKIL